MRTYISPIGYDTRRVTRPVINAGLGSEDEVVLLRPENESDTERAAQAIADVEQLLQEIEPNATCTLERIPTTVIEDAILECATRITAVPDGRDAIVSFGGGARDVLLPLVVATLVHADAVDRALFFSDLDGSVEEWPLPHLSRQVPDRTIPTRKAISAADDWISLSEIAERTDQSKSTVIRHVQDLEDVGLIESDTSEKKKRVKLSFSGTLFHESRRG